MYNSMKSESMGEFIYDEISSMYERMIGKVNYALRLDHDHANSSELMSRAEKLFNSIEQFEMSAKQQIAQHLIDYKNDVWLEYDEDDEDLDWEAVDAGEYDVSIDDFVKCITILDIEIENREIYCEFDDGGLFGGHRIHARFNNDYLLVDASI